MSNASIYITLSAHMLDLKYTTLRWQATPFILIYHCNMH